MQQVHFLAAHNMMNDSIPQSSLVATEVENESTSSPINQESPRRQHDIFELSWPPTNVRLVDVVHGWMLVANPF